MKNKIFRRIIALTIAVLMLAGGMISVSAASAQYVPYESYTYWDDISGAGRKLVYNRPMYETTAVIDRTTLGIEAFASLVDVCTDNKGYTYLLDSESRIVVLDENYNFVKEITSIIGEEELNFVGAQNIFVHTDYSIYICDTENKRVLHCDADGNHLDTFILPESPLIPENFDYRPIKVVADSRGYIYVLSEGSYYGALLYAPDKSFIGFYGANTVNGNILDTLNSLLNRMFPNNEMKGRDTRVLPYTFSDLIITDDDFVYTATDDPNSGQIKKLNPGAGNNILGSDGVRFIDDGVNRTFNLGEPLTQRIIGLEVDSEEFMYALDSAYGRIFVYDAECRMITAFGGGMGNGTQAGTFMYAEAIALKGEDILVCDRGTGAVTVFSRNEFGKKVMALTKMTIDGDYVESKEGWEEVRKLDKNLQIAYTGVARAYLAEENYKAAMDVALEGYDRDTYALAYEYYRLEWINDNFTAVFLVALGVIAILVTAIVIISKKKITLIKNGEVKLALQTLIHPGVTFEEIKDKKRGSVVIAMVILALFYVSAVIQEMWGGFLFTNYDPGTFNSLWVLVRSAGLVALWVVANWLICTLMGGKGKMKEIIIVTCYSLMPLIIERVIWIVLSNFLLPTEGSFLSILSTVAIIYFLLLFVIGMLRIHDFTMGRFIWTSLLTVLAMAAIIFLMILVGILLQQLGGFVSTIFIELLM